MSDCSNGVKRGDSKTEDIAPKVGFRGFIKQPFVMLTPFDIKPYLKVQKQPFLNNARKTDELDKLLMKCTVQLVNEDLETLKAEYLKRKRLKFNVGANRGYLKKKTANTKCKFCDKVYCSEKRLLNHLDNNHMIELKQQNNKQKKRVSFSEHVIVHELKEYHRCRKCNKIFDDYKLLKMHRKRWHKKRKCYICHFCNKSFLDRVFFKVHIKLHCDVCGLLFPNKTKYLEHRRTVCRVLKRHTCKTCHESYFRIMDLKDHSYEHIHNLFVCDICKDQFETKCAVSHHILFLHSHQQSTEMYVTRNTGTETLYSCHFCDLTSVDRNILELHIANLPDLTNRAVTGYKDYYFCDQCLLNFQTEKDMLRHKWTHFLKTTDTSQEPSEELEQNEEEDGAVKTTWRSDEFILESMKPKVVLERIKTKEALPESVLPAEAVSPISVLPKPVISEPVLPKPVISEPVLPKTAISEPVLSKPVISEPVLPKPSLLESVLSEPVIPKPILLEPILQKTVLPDTNVSVDENCFDAVTGELKKAIVKSRKTLLSKHQCPLCGKYYSTNYCLNRHIQTHQCSVCEETFVWPSLLRTHKCIRLNLPEMPFDDARPEIHFDNMLALNQNGFDDMNIGENNGFIEPLHFEIPAPIVDLTEYEDLQPNNNNHSNMVGDVDKNNVVIGYKLVMQEVPIEF